MTKSLAVQLATRAPTRAPGPDQFHPKQVYLWPNPPDSNDVMVALDQEKAYDKIDHGYLTQVLRHFNLPEPFVRRSSLCTEMLTQPSWWMGS